MKKTSQHKRGQVYWVNLDPTIGSEIRKKRPCVIVSVDPINGARRTVLVVPLSTAATPRPPLVVAVPSVGTGSCAVCDQIRAVDKTRLAGMLGKIDADDMAEVEKSLRVVMGLCV